MIPVKEFILVIENHLRLSHVLFLINPQSNLRCQLPDSRIISIHSGNLNLLTFDLVLAILEILMQYIKQIFTHALQIFVKVIRVCYSNQAKIMISFKAIEILKSFDLYIPNTEYWIFLKITIKVCRVQIPLLLCQE